MTDQHLGSGLRAWLKDTEARPDDVRRSTDKVMARVEEAGQRGRWWPLPVLQWKRRRTQATAIDTTAYQPTPIPATNGHAPTVIGRTHTMFSPVKAIIAGALVFALGGLFLVGQPFTQQQGQRFGAATEVAVGPDTIYFTGTTECTLESRESKAVDGVSQNEEHYTCDLATTDSRLAGTEEIDLIAYITPGPGGPWTAEAVLAMDEGSWSGTAQGVYDTDRPFDYGEVAYLGDGAYEGLVAHYYFAGQGDMYSLTGWITSSE